MNTQTYSTPNPMATHLLAEVDFKWLMAGQGCWVDPQRLLADPAYADQCLQDAQKSPCDALRQCAGRLQQVLRPIA